MTEKEYENSETKKFIEIAIKQCAEIARNKFSGGTDKILNPFKAVGDCIAEEILKQLEPEDGHSELDTCITQIQKKQWHSKPYPLPELIRALITISERLKKLEKTGE